MQVRTPKPRPRMDEKTMKDLYFDSRGRYCPHKSERRQEQLVAERARTNARRRQAFNKENPITPELYQHAVTLVGNIFKD